MSVASNLRAVARSKPVRAGLCRFSALADTNARRIVKWTEPPPPMPPVLRRAVVPSDPKRFASTAAAAAPRPPGEKSIDSFVREVLLSHSSLSQFCDEVIRKLHAVSVDTVKDINKVSEREWLELSFPPGLEVALKNACWGEGDVDYKETLQWAPNAFPNLMTHPLYAAEHLGRPMPDSPHACSVGLPLWEHVVGYEEGDQKVVNALQLGYPRFFIHPYVAKVFHKAQQRFAVSENEATWVFPNRETANKCVAFVQSQVGFGAITRIDPLGSMGVGPCAVTFSKALFHVVKKFWQHFGEIISSRQAADLLQEGKNGEVVVHYPTAQQAKQYVREQIAQRTGQTSTEHVRLFATGMGAISRAVQIGQARCPGTKSVQLGFPYLDVLKVQTVWGPGAHFLPEASSKCLDTIQAILDRGEKISFIMLEFPGNPLLQVMDVKRLSEICRAHKVPLFIDETIASFDNVDVTPYADVILTSLTKWFNGAGDVAAGSLVINEKSPMFKELSLLYSAIGGQDTLYDADAVALAKNCQDFPERMSKANQTTKKLIDFLKRHPKVARIYFPSTNAEADGFKDPGLELFKKDAQGNQWFGGMFSMDLVDPEITAIPFYNNMRLNKGPSLGCNFSLLCSYAMLAHYDELDWVESLGISRYIMRVSVGQEEPEDLIERFKQVLDKLPSKTSDEVTL